MEPLARKRRRITPPPMSLNLTPLIDVIFQLLIFMAITANFAVDEGVLSARLPRETGGGGAGAESIALPVSPLTITLSPAGDTGCRISIDGAAGSAAASFAELHDQLAALQYDPGRGRTAGLHKPDDPLLIVTERQVRWQHVVDAVNAVVRAGYTNFAFAELP